MNLPYEIWDVFTDKPLQGNPLAVIPDATHLNDTQMQAIAKEFNLSETSFIFPSDKADFRARYFTTSRELPMAGHPTIGTIFALHPHGKIKGETVKLELKAGIFEISLEQKPNKLQRAWMNQGVPKKIADVSDRNQVANALGLNANDFMDLPISEVSAGNPFVVIPVKSANVLAKARLTPYMLPKTDSAARVGAFVFTTDTTSAKVQCRMFAEANGTIFEDPATGSAHGPLGWYLATHGLLEFNNTAEFISHQGVEMGRPSEVYVRVTKDFSVSVGGQAVLVGEGRLYL